MDRSKSGFTLPTVMIVSIIMFGVLTLAMQFVSQSTSSLRDIYYRQLAREAVESGTIHAQECLRLNGYVASWTAAKPLRPNTDCNGNVVSGSSLDILSSSTVQSRYEVGLPQRSSAGAQRIGVVARVNLLSSGTSSVWNSYTVTEYVNVGATTSFSNVVFGYNGSLGSFFSAMYPGGRVMSTGYNGQGQHGKGSYASSASPSPFQLPAGEKAVGIHTSFLSSGSRIFVSTDKGNLYGSGLGTSGQLGDGFFSTRTIPVKFKLPAGVSPRLVSLLQDTTFVVGSNNNVYSSGACWYGVLGNAAAISGCSSVSNPVRVNLPTVTTNLNTRPGLNEGDIVSDGNAIFVRMQGGAVYGWGRNHRGQFGNGTTTDSSTPVRVGTFGNSGQPFITQISFDGDTLYMLDSSGKVWVTGSGSNGTLAGAGTRIKNWGSNGSDGLCLDSTGVASGGQLKATACSSASGQIFEWLPLEATLNSPYRSRGQIRAVSSGLCVKNRGASAGASNTNGNPIELVACNSASVQHLWEYRSNGRSIFWSSSGTRCLDKSGANLAQLWDCNGSAAQWWTIEDSTIPRAVPLPAGLKVSKVVTDQWSVLFLMSDGSVWGSGSDSLGQLGNGRGQEFNAALRPFELPAGAQAIDVYTTSYGMANTFVVLSDGRVYGSGSNDYGQLGIGTTSTSPQLVPVRMSLPSGAVAKSVQVGRGTAIVLTTTGQIYTVGNNSHGQLGDGTTVNSSTPQARQYVNVLPPVIF